MAGRKKKRNIWMVPVIAAAAVLVFGGVMVYRGVDRLQAEQASDSVSAEQAESPSSNEQENTVTWNGNEYVYNDHLSNFLFLGIDTREKTETQTGRADAGQADALFLLSWDRVSGSLSLISIPRDTMTSIEVFSADGESLGMTTDHISLSFAYGDGGHKSCELTEAAVSNLFYGIPIQGYCAINMDGIPVLTDGIGGVTVTVPNDSLEDVDPSFQEGAQILLTGENAETFVRYRDTETSQSALDRQERQDAFLSAYGQQAAEAFQKDAGILTDLYEALDPYMVTNIGNDQLVKIAESAAGGGSMNRWTVPGEGTEGSSFDEYHVDDDQLYTKILETFYELAE